MTERRGPPELIGLVLAGGESSRMRRDKGTLEYHGVPQAEHCHRLLTACCAHVFVSVNARQSARHPYRELPLIEDQGIVAGPAAGLLAAWAAYPDAALLTLAVDLPLVDAALLDHLVRHRNPDKAATVYAHADGVLEPLCAIWEPVLRSALYKASGDGNPSLRRLFGAADVERLEPPDPRQIESVNSVEAYRQVLTVLGRS